MNLSFCELVRKLLIGTRNMVTKNKTKTVREEVDLVCLQISLCVCVLARTMLGDTRLESRCSILVHIVYRSF